MTTSPISLIHIVRPPRVSPASGKPPMLVLLHGLGSNEEDLMGLADRIDPRFLTISIRAPQVVGPYGYGWYTISGSIGNLSHDEDEAEAGRAAAEKAVVELTGAYDADPERVYLMGFSQGAVMSLGIALTRPELIAGAVIMSGALLGNFASRTRSGEELRGLRLIVAHGRWDEILPIDEGRKIRHFLEDLPVDLTYDEYPMGHEVSLESIDRIDHWLTRALNEPRRAG